MKVSSSEANANQNSMKPLHIALAVLVAVIWGIAFVVSKVGLESFTPPQLTALRFFIPAIAAIWLPRPNVSWPMLIAIGLTIFTGQFLLQFFGISYGMPAGLTAVVSQTQALFTVLFAAIAIGDKPGLKQFFGMLVAFIGLLMIGLTIGGTITLLGFLLTLASAISWAIGNVLVKRSPKVNMLHLMVWASLVPHRGVQVKENPAGRGPHGAIRQSRKGNGLARKESPAGVGGANVTGSSKFRQYFPFVLQSHDFVDEYYSERNASIFCRRRSAGGALQSLLNSAGSHDP